MVPTMASLLTALVVTKARLQLARLKQVIWQKAAASSRRGGPLSNPVLEEGGKRVSKPALHVTSEVIRVVMALRNQLSRCYQTTKAVNNRADPRCLVARLSPMSIRNDHHEASRHVTFYVTECMSMTHYCIALYLKKNFSNLLSFLDCIAPALDLR